jgi:cytochrome c-type biogenesis protein CcmH
VRNPLSIVLLAALALSAGLAAPSAAQENDSSPPLAGPAETQGAQTSLADIEDEVMCPICGTTLQLSQSPQADRERAFIRRQIAEGRTKDEIKDALVAEFGPEVLALPESEGFDLAAWLVPGAAILLAAAGIAVGLWRWRRARPGGPARAAVLDSAESERLDSDIARYDL